MSEQDISDGPADLMENLWGFTIISVGGYALLAAGMQVASMKSRFRQRKVAAEAGEAESLSPPLVPAAEVAVASL